VTHTRSEDHLCRHKHLLSRLYEEAFIKQGLILLSEKHSSIDLVHCLFSSPTTCFGCLFQPLLAYTEASPLFTLFVNLYSYLMAAEIDSRNM
jgi:hypothetical protein